MNEPTIPYFDIPNPKEHKIGALKRKRRSYNPQDAWPLELNREEFVEDKEAKTLSMLGDMTAQSQ